MEPKKIEGWFTIATDNEYGPTLVRWIREGEPTHAPVTSCEILDDPDYEEVPIINEGFDGIFIHAEIIVKIIETKKLNSN